MAIAPTVPTPAEPLSDGRIPIVLGVTGHRTLREADEQPITLQLRALLAQLAREAPASPLVLLTALAEGADRLVAKIAREAGARLVAVLPLPAAAYEQDFESAASRAEFHAMLADPRTDKRITLPTLDPAAHGPGDARDAQYLLAGLYIARNSDVLIALWDGAAARGTGGTAQIVEFRRTGRLDAPLGVRTALAAAPDPFRVIDPPLDAAQTGLVYHVPVVRPTVADAPPSASSGWLIPARHDGSPRARERFVHASLSTVRHRDAFNRDGATYRAAHPLRVATSRAWLTLGDDSVGAATDGDRIGSTFALADALAIAHQKSVYRTLIALFTLVSIATVSLILRNLASTDGSRREYLAGYLLLLGVADLVYLRTRWRSSQDRFQDYRALAEGLRVQFFWRLAGSARAAADYYLRKQRSELRWIRDALRVCALRSSPGSLASADTVATLWVADQRKYFHDSSVRDGHRRLRQRTVGSVLILASLGATLRLLWRSADGDLTFVAIALLVALILLAHAIYELASASRESESIDRTQMLDIAVLIATGLGISLALYAAMAWVAPSYMGAHPEFALVDAMLDWKLAAIGIMALIGTFAHAYANIRAFGQHTKQYERMADLFTSAADALARARADGAPDVTDRILFDLGREALAEHADWLQLHRDRPIELPTAEL